MGNLVTLCTGAALLLVTACATTSPSPAPQRAPTLQALSPANERAALQYLAAHPAALERCVAWEHEASADGVVHCSRYAKP